MVQGLAPDLGLRLGVGHLVCRQFFELLGHLTGVEAEAEDFGVEEGVVIVVADLYRGELLEGEERPVDFVLAV